MISAGGTMIEAHEPKEVAEVVSGADVIVSATGKFHIITSEMVKNSAVVLDVGEPQEDVEFEKISKKASFITPVPNGVGPVTVVSLMENLVELVSFG